MVRADVFDGIDQLLRAYRHSGEPFGGVQMILIGDVYQLPPVVDKSDKNVNNVEAYFQDAYGGVYFFNSPGFKAADFRYFELRTPYRHKGDGRFFELLNAVRENTITNEQLEELNKRCSGPHDGAITVCPHRGQAQGINNAKIAALATPLFQYQADITGGYKDAVKPKDYPAPETLEVKEGAQIMMVKNDKNYRWVNGSIGCIEELSKNRVVVNIGGFTCSVDREIWEAVDYVYIKESKLLIANIVGTFTQYPLMPAWAVTVHKSQGKTFEQINIDLGGGAFEFGQAYVALSRCKTLAGITLARPIRRDDIKPIRNEVKQFLEEMAAKAIE
jgi:hypothetical protein